MKKTAWKTEGPAELSSSPSVLSDEEARFLLERVRGGEIQAFRRIYDAYKAPIMAYVRHSLKSEMAAEELAQDVFLKAYAAVGSFRGDAKVSTWLWSIARNAVVDHRRKKGELSLQMDAETGESAADHLVDTQADAEALLVSAADERALQGCVEALAPAQREALLLRTVGELSLADIAQQTGATESAVKSLLFRARESLSKCLLAKAGA